jgi:mRNA interferase MazF
MIQTTSPKYDESKRTWSPCVRGDLYPVKGIKDRGGHEQRGPRFAVALQSDDLLLSTVIVALTSTSCAPSMNRPEVDLADGRTTRIMVDQITAIDWSRLGDPIAHLSYDDMQAVDVAIGNVLSI